MELANESGDVYSRLLSYSCHGVSCLGKGDIDGALRYLSDGLTVAVQVDQFYWVPGNHQFLGDTYHELGEYQKAIVHYQEAIRNLGRSGNLPSWKNLIELALIRTKLAANEQPESRRVGNLIVAQQYLTRAIDIFKECGADGWVERYEKELIASS